MLRIFFLLSTLVMFGCSVIKSGVEKVENVGYRVSDKVNQKNSCSSETTQQTIDASTYQYYRCVGEHCQSHGCKN